jgi:hypothetical protein
MSIRFFCPLGHRLQVPNQRAGKKGRCPICGQRLVVPEVSTDQKKRRGSKPGRGKVSAAATQGPLDSAPPPPAESPPPNPQQGIEKLELVEPTAPAPSVVLISPPPLPAAAAMPSGNGVVVTPPAAPSTSAAPLRRVQWLAWAGGDEVDAFAVDRPTPRQLEVVYWLACLLPFAAVFCAAPAMPHLQFAGAPTWAQTLLCIASLQLAYAAWLATAPDWGTVRVGMYLFAAIAVIDVLAAAALPLLPDASVSSAGLSEMRATASAWCGLAAVINALSSAGCRWLDHRWRGGEL